MKMANNWIKLIIGTEAQDMYVPVANSDMRCTTFSL